MKQTLQKRNSGLDFFRTLAIFLVLLSHVRHLFTYLHFKNFNIWYLSIGGFLGVELFFVLSGFLIGDQIYKYIINSKNKYHNLRIFYIRRWYRTLPLYYLFLLIYFFFHILFFNQLYIPYLHLFFLQNFDSEAIKFFAVSWSLSVEEWFYLIIPFLILVYFILTQKKLLPLLIVFFLIGVIKAYIVYIHPDLTWTDIRKNIFLRFDSLIVGVFFAYLKNYKPDFFSLFAKKNIFFIAILFLILLSVWYWYKLQPGLDKDFFSKAFMFQITSIVLSSIMIYLYFNFKSNSKIWYYGAIYSYSIYLMHFLFLLPFIKLAHYYHSVLLSFLILFVFLIILIVLARFIYNYIESPVLKKRPQYLI
ncbi:MAG: acyltransferase [Chlorobi bacterium]|nr:acyltransferase [Chlorobiota bacterium]